jgi:hypothetical protein
MSLKIIFFNKYKVRPIQKNCYIKIFLLFYLLIKNLKIKYNVCLDKYRVHYIICFITNLKKKIYKSINPIYEKNII